MGGDITKYDQGYCDVVLPLTNIGFRKSPSIIINLITTLTRVSVAVFKERTS